VLEALHEIWPDAPVFTSVYLPEFLGPHKKRFKNWHIQTSWLQFLPFKNKLISPLRLIAPFMFKSFDFSQFDIVIVSATGAYSPNGKWKMENGKSPLQICYSHTPPRYLYGYATAREWKNNLLFRILGEIANHFLRLIDFKSAQNVDFFIANSKNVAARIKKFYRRESKVIYPPVAQGPVGLRPRPTSSVALLPAGARRGSPAPATLRSYFLAGGRIARPKHIDLIIETFTKLNLPLVVFGREFAGSNEIKNTNQNSKVQFLGEISDQEKMELMKNARAFVFAAEDEDFGITPVEAMGVGTPVIAFASGGVLETVIDGKTGVLYRFNDLNHLSEAIQRFGKMKFDRESIIKHAQKFSKERFKKKIREFVDSKMK
jgi:glycosyltransferase involved in cell wall biosynthesis